MQVILLNSLPLVSWSWKNQTILHLNTQLQSKQCHKILFSLHSIKSRGFIKGQALDKLTSCEDNFAIQRKVFLIIKNVQLKKFCFLVKPSCPLAENINETPDQETRITCTSTPPGWDTGTNQGHSATNYPGGHNTLLRIGTNLTLNLTTSPSPKPDHYKMPLTPNLNPPTTASPSPCSKPCY